MRGRLDIYIHQPVANARESHRTRDAQYELTFLTDNGKEVKERVKASSQSEAERLGRGREWKNYSLASVKFVKDD